MSKSPVAASSTSPAATGSPTNTRLSLEDYNQMLVVVGTSWRRDSVVLNFLKLLLTDFKEFAIDTIQRETSPFKLFKLFEGAGYIKRSDIGLIGEATELVGLKGVKEAIEDVIPTFQGFGDVTKSYFSNHLHDLVRLGRAMQIADRELLGELYNLTADQCKDPWILIFELQHKRIINKDSKASFIEILKKNKMVSAAAAYQGEA